MMNLIVYQIYWDTFALLLRLLTATGVTYDVLYVMNKQIERRKKGGTIVWRVWNSDYRTFVRAMRIDVMSYINTPSESMTYCKEDMDSKFG